MKLIITFLTMFIILGNTYIVQSDTPVTNKQAQIDLGNALYSDMSLSTNNNQSCATCHNPVSGTFIDDRAPVQELIDAGWPVSVPPPVSMGSILTLFGGRNSPSAAYAMFSPFFMFDDINGLYVGGQFWDGRENSLAGQASKPFLNPVEMALPDKKAVIQALQNDLEVNGYQALFLSAYGTEDGGYNLSMVDSSNNQSVLEAYDLMTKAIGEFEKTQLFNKFNSKFDYYIAGKGTLVKEERKGLNIFNGKGKCNLCHITEKTFAPNGSAMPPLLTDFTYDNLGIPVNDFIEVVNPGLPIDNGLGAIVNDDLQNGKFKVVTLRNIELTAPYGHNGVFQTLEQIVHFYNTRDTLDVCTSNLDPGFGVTCWPVPEVSENVNVEELGNLGLTDREEQHIVTFLKTLTDRDLQDYPPVFLSSDFPPKP